MTDFKVGDTVKIKPNHKGELIVYNGYKGYDYLNNIKTIERIDYNKVYLSGLLAQVDIQCIEKVKSELKLYVTEYIYKRPDGTIEMSNIKPALTDSDWITDLSFTLNGIEVDLSDFNWNQSLHRVNKDYSLTKIEPDIYKIYTVNFNNCVYEFPEEDLKQWIKAIRNSGYQI